MKHEQEVSSRRDFLVKSAGLGLAALGSGMLYRSWTLRPDFSHRPVTSQDAQETPSSPESAPHTITDGTLVITQEERIGNVYLDRLASMYHKFEPFGPYGYVVIGERESVEDGTVWVNPETVMATDAHRRLPALFAKSLVRNALERGENYQAISAYSNFMRLIENDFSVDTYYEPEAVETALTVLNPRPEEGNGYREDPLEAFGAVSAVLYNASDAVKERVLELPTSTVDDYAGYPIVVDSPERDLCERLLSATLNVYNGLLPKEMGNPAKDRCLDALFYKIGLLRYAVLRT